jgi:hypothetical protein
MVSKLGRAAQARGIALSVAAALLVTSGVAFAQLNPMPGGSPALGVPGIAAPTVGGTGIPLGSTELSAGGLSPVPLGASPGLTPFGSSTTVTTTLGGLGATGTTTSGIAGSMSSLGSGLSPGVTPPTGLSLGMPTQTPGVTNYGVGGMQRLPGSVTGVGTGTLP